MPHYCGLNGIGINVQGSEVAAPALSASTHMCGAQFSLGIEPGSTPRSTEADDSVTVSFLSILR